MRYLYALCTWGMGHASRSLPIIRKLIEEGNEVTVLTAGRSMRMLRNELGDAADYREILTYPAPYSAGRISFYLKFGFTLPKMLKSIKKEHEIVENMLSKEKYHRIISDNKYGIYSTSVPSFLITHQLRFMAPKRIGFIERMGERFVASHSENFTAYIVPDDEEGTLSGELSHNLNYVEKKRIVYSGPLSDFSKKAGNTDIDLLISISGPEPQRSILERMVYEQQADFPERTVITLGKSEKFEAGHWKKARVYTYLTRKEREDIMNRSKLIVSRSGYSTIMDLAVLGKKAAFVPTPGQTEQEYLSDYHMEKKTYFSMEQSHFSIKKMMESAPRYTGIRMEGKKSIERVMEVIS